MSYSSYKILFKQITISLYMIIQEHATLDQNLTFIMS